MTQLAKKTHRCPVGCPAFQIRKYPMVHRKTKCLAVTSPPKQGLGTYILLSLAVHPNCLTKQSELHS